jgi:hypothetical protein
LACSPWQSIVACGQAEPLQPDANIVCVFARYNELSCETSLSVKAPDAAEGAGEQRQPESFRSEGSD